MFIYRCLNKALIISIISFVLAGFPGSEDIKAQSDGRASYIESLKTEWTSPPEAFPLAQSTGAPLLGNGNMAVCFGGPAHQLRFYINRNDFWKLCRSETSAQKIPALLDLRITGLQGAGYRLEQNLHDGTVIGKFFKDNVTVQLTCWLAATDDLLVVTLNAEGGESAVEVDLKTITGSGSEVNTGSTGAVYWVTRKFEKDVDTPAETATALRMMNAEGTGFVLKPGHPVTLVVATASKYLNTNPVDTAIDLVSRSTEEKIKVLRLEHEKWWEAYWARSNVEFNDPVLMRGYYQGLYTLGACCRNPDFPPGIFGPWITDDNPSWSNDYHLNYNFQTPFYGLCSANRLEQADVEYGPVLAFIPQGRWYAEHVTKTRGVLYPVGIGPLGSEPSRGVPYGVELGSTEHGGLFHHQRSNAAYCLVNIAQRWRCTYDIEYARKVYPFVLAVADFWEDYLKLVDGKYHIHGDAIHELSGANKDPILTLGLLHNSFDLVLDMSETMNVDADRREKWSHILRNLANFPVQEMNGRKVFRYTAEGMGWCAGNTLGIQHIYPASAITLNSDPKLLEISRNTITAMNRWDDGNGSNSFFPATVRLGYDPEVILDHLRKYIANMHPNGFRKNNPHGVENCSTVHNTINEMLCMSVGHVLRLFPVWPPDMDASFENLRAWDAFLVSAELKDGIVKNVLILSELGRNCEVENPWPDVNVAVIRNGVKKELLSGNRLKFGTVKEELIELIPVRQ